MDDAVERRHGRLGLEGRRARERLVERGSEGVDVGAPVDHVRVPAGLLGRHVGGGPDDRAVLGETLGRVEVLRQAEVGQDRLARARDQDVRRLHVPVEDPLRVGDRERARELARDERRAPGGEGPLLLEADVERLSLDVVHDEEGPGAALADLVHRDDVGVAEARHGARLEPEPFDLAVRAEETGAQDLEGHVAPEVPVEGPVDDPHAALAELLGDLVAPDPLGRGLGDPAPRVARGPEDRGVARRVVGSERRRHPREATT